MDVKWERTLKQANIEVQAVAAFNNRFTQQWYKQN